MGLHSAYQSALPHDAHPLECTERGRAILRLVAAGLTNFEIASDLHLSPHTVAQHIAEMLRAANARSRAELVARAYYDGILSLDSWPPELQQQDISMKLST